MYLLTYGAGGTSLLNIFVYIDNDVLELDVNWMFDD